MSDRNQQIVERVARAEKDMLDFKSSQIFGKDVTKPKLIQRFNSDGSPTTVDVIGTQESAFGGFSYLARGWVTFQALTQKSPWATVIVEATISPTGGLADPSNVSWEVFVDQNSLFTDDGIVKFRLDAGSSNLGSASGIFTDTDRLWLKIFVYATDYGIMTLDYPAISPVDGIGRGYVVPLT